MVKTYNPRPMIEDIIAFVSAENQDKSEFKDLDVSWFAKEHCDDSELKELFDHAYLKDKKNVIHDVLKDFMINNPNFTRFVVEFEAPNTPTYRPLDYLDYRSEGVLYSYDTELFPWELEERLKCDLYNIAVIYLKGYMQKNNITYNKKLFFSKKYEDVIYDYRIINHFLYYFSQEAYKRNLVTLNGGI